MTETENWLYEIRLRRAAQLQTAMTLSECGVRVLREATESKPTNEKREVQV